MTLHTPDPNPAQQPQDPDLNIAGGQLNREQRRQLILARCELVDYDISKWPDIERDIMEVNRSAYAYLNSWQMDAFMTDPHMQRPIWTGQTLDDPTGVLLQDKDTEKILGYTLAGRLYSSALAATVSVPMKQDPGVAHILWTSLAEEVQGAGLARPMLERLEQKLLLKGYDKLERDAQVNNGWADSVEKHSADRIIEKHTYHCPVMGEKRYFLLSIGATPVQ